MIARTTFTNMRTQLSCRGINLKTRLRAIKCYIWPTLFYGAETWTITKSLLSRLDAFEMWVYRRVLKISWTEKITNEEVLRRIGTDREIVRQFKNRKLQYLGHHIDTIIFLKSVCLSVGVRKLQVAILARSSWEMYLTVRIV